MDDMTTAEMIEEEVPESPEELSTERVTVEIPADEEPKKVLGIFDSEEQALATLQAAREKLEYYAKDDQHRLVEQQKVEAQRQYEAAQQAALAEDARVLEEVKRLHNAGQYEAAFALHTNHAAAKAQRGIDQVVEQKLGQILGPLLSRQQLLSNEQLAPIHSFADDAIYMEQHGLQRGYIVDLMNRLMGKQAPTRGTTPPRGRARMSVVESPDSVGDATNLDDATFAKASKAYWKKVKW